MLVMTDIVYLVSSVLSFPASWCIFDPDLAFLPLPPRQLLMEVYKLSFISPGLLFPAPMPAENIMSHLKTHFHFTLLTSKEFDNFHNSNSKLNDQNTSKVKWTCTKVVLVLCLPETLATCWKELKMLFVSSKRIIRHFVISLDISDFLTPLSGSKLILTSCWIEESWSEVQAQI